MTYPLPFGRRPQGPALAAQHPAERVVLCANCQEALQGLFCHSCGQPAKVRNSVFDLARDLWSRLVDVNLGSIAGLARLVITPGTLIADWLAGRRVRTLAPWPALMLALPACYLMALAFNLDHKPGDLFQRIAQGAEHWRFSSVVRLCAMMPCHFLALSILLAGRRTSAYAHLVTTIYQFAFILLLTPVAFLVMKWSINLSLELFLLGLLAHALSLNKGAYGLSWFGAAWRTGLLLFFDLIAFATVGTFAGLQFDS